MAARKAAKKPATAAAKDLGEDVVLMEPMYFEEGSAALNKLREQAFELSQASTAFKASIAAGLVTPLADLVRSMNCYYSNLIENHDTHPVDIERAVHGELSQDPKKRDLQFEAKAHIEVQRWIDEGGLDGRELTRDGLLEIHRRFISLLPDEMRGVEDPESKERVEVEPGVLRSRGAKVGLHVAVSPGALPRFLARFEQVYGRHGKLDRVVAAGPAHHRLLWVHPFADGNGRVTRLMSYAVLRQALGTGGLWSISRGLARRVDDYKRLLAKCDMKRRNDLDGRGNLSMEAMSEFALFFLDVCQDQVSFMSSLMQPAALRDRILWWAAEEIQYGRLPDQAPKLLDAVLFKGSLPRGEVAEIVGKSERTARNVATALSHAGIIQSAGVRDDWRIAFPAALAPRLMPGLFPAHRAAAPTTFTLI